MADVDPTLQQLERALDGQRWGMGERMPPERELARDLGVGRSALRRALSKLEARGRIRRHVGQGTFVAAPPAEEVTATLRLSPPPGPADVVELRLMIEPAIAAAAALRASDPAIARLRVLAAEGAEARDWQSWETADSRFHTALAQAARNPLLSGVLETLNVIRRQREWGELRRTTLTSARQQTYSRQHAALVDAVARRDAPGSAAAMRAHLVAVQRSMIGDSGDPALAALTLTGDLHD